VQKLESTAATSSAGAVPVAAIPAG